MKTLFSGKFPVSWWRGYVCSSNFDGEPSDGIRGQKNGLLGVAELDCILMCFGVHTASVDLEIRLHEDRPVLEDIWEEVVEASFLVRAACVGTNATPPSHGAEEVKLSLCSFLALYSRDFYIPEGSYRLRYCARNFGALESDDEEFPDQHEYYELSFWPAPMDSEEIIRITKDEARWHHEFRQRDTAKGLP